MGSQTSRCRRLNEHARASSAKPLADQSSRGENLFSTMSHMSSIRSAFQSVSSRRDSYGSGNPHSSTFPRRSTSEIPSDSSRSSCTSKSSQRSWDKNDEFDQVLHATIDDLDEHIELLKFPRFKSLFNGKSSSQSRIQEDARRVLKRMRSNLESKLGKSGGAREEITQNNTDPHSLHDRRTP